MADKKFSKYKMTKKKKAPVKREPSYIAPIIIGLFAVITLLALPPFELAGSVGGWYSSVLLGLFSAGAYLIPVILGVICVMYRRFTEEKCLGSKIFLMSLSGLLFDLLLHVFLAGDHSLSLKMHYANGREFFGGGAVGSFLGEIMWRGLNFCMIIVLLVALAIIIPLIFDLTPKAITEYFIYKIKLSHLKSLDRREEREKSVAEARKRAEREAGVVAYGKYKNEQIPLPFDDSTDPKPKKKQEKPMDTDLNPEEMLLNSAEPEEKEPEVTVEAPPETFEDSRVEIINEIPDKTAEDVVEEKENIDLTKMFEDETDEELVRKLAQMYGGDADSENTSAELEIIRESVSDVLPEEDISEGICESDEYAEKEYGFPQAPLYKFPPIEMLTEDPGKRDPNIKRETEENAKRLTEALSSFNVRAAIQNCSHGPTVTRYELSPESGTRVRTIANLVDDISLSLAAPGSVRIEAPIPGKSAVGIEVPNRTRSTVYLRSLIDSEEFRTSKSKTYTSLGEDVAGCGVFFDIAKMPHLLIAGATGMGKSVCINCVIISLLYKASPDEVKLILIDPKKVEFSMYNGLPHLLVPVVSDPKKAAGSLSWAVNEMERRFSLIEEVGMRDIGGYNKVAEKEGNREKLPQIVIIIDELADLMMTAKDSVESSICRLAQKARAAGMYLIIGTQRPSVDVITGLIKANVPSRIACTVASQTDSRTIIDRGGAEKLLGRGDMLFNPVGAQKPTRVQGAFVSEEEVEKIVEFIKGSSGVEVSYNDEVSAEIEREAARCVTDKKGAAAQVLPSEGAEDEDPMLRSALELAVESGKISTSLIQRRLSLGYGRSAKLIDRMEQLGYVSAPDGQKPREVLITKEQFMEMVLRDGEM